MANAHIGADAAKSHPAADPAANGHHKNGDHAGHSHHKGEEYAAHPPQRLGVLTLGALGVVYGDIGTSPIYAFREALVASAGGEMASREDILGVLSLIIWALTIIVTIKYILFVLRADNRGEGGTLSLMALARGRFRRSGRVWILILGMLGAALFYGDAVITPAISVLSAVEGMEVVTPTFEPYVVPLTWSFWRFCLPLNASEPAVSAWCSGRSAGVVPGHRCLRLYHIFDDPEFLRSQSILAIELSW